MAMRLSLLTALLLFTSLWVCAAHALSIEFQADSVEYPGLPTPIQNLKFECRTTNEQTPIHCRNGSASIRLAEQVLKAHFELTQDQDGVIHITGNSQVSGLTVSELTGRYATENLEASLRFSTKLQGSRMTSDIRLDVPQGQAYIEPVFVDFSQAPASLHWQMTLLEDGIDIDLKRLEQDGLLQAHGQIELRDGSLASAKLEAELPRLASANETYFQPFVLGTPWESLRTDGQGQLSLTVRQASPHSASLSLRDVELSYGDRADMQGVDAELHWSAESRASTSRLRWESAQISRLPLDSAAAHFRLHPRGISLENSLHIGVAGGALKLYRLSVRGAGEDQMQAELDAEIVPIDLATLCRALDWPEFSGTLSGRLPGLRLADNELRLEGALRAEAFDGTVRVDKLRVLNPFGRVPRLVSDISMRNLDLAALTSAFSFGRIEGRLEGEVTDLRLRRWRPVAFNARLATPKQDRSRHRISQRAIDNISSIGGGPTGILSRGVLRFFDDFAYERIGWSCVLRDGVCHMDGLEPARNGGYVLVKGRLLPRIDVVGFSRQVDWNTFVDQVRQAIRGSGDLQLR